MATRHYWINKTSKSPEMKSIREIFKTNPSLLDEPEVAKLLEYCEQLQDEIVEFKFEKNNNKELAMIDMQCSSAGTQTLRLTNVHKLISY
jgi:hypothetical protein